MIQFLLILAHSIFIVLLGIRILRWWAITQQKEYRLDRMVLFLQSQEGMRDFLLPWPLTLHRWPNATDIKRPRLTPRALIVATVSLFLIVILYWLAWHQGSFTEYMALYLAIPALVLGSSAPTALAARLITQVQLSKAKALLAAHEPTIIGITGSYGKSSTKLLLYHILSRHQPTFTTPKSFNTRYSVAKSIVDGYKGQKLAILEYGAYTKGEIKTLASWFKPNVAIITGITQQHLGLFGSLEEIIKAKSELIKALPEQGTVFFNASDLLVQQMCESITVQKVPYAGKNSELKISDVTVDNNGKLGFTWNNAQISTQLIGKQYLVNILGAITVAQFFGVPDKQIQEGLADFKPTDNFIQSKNIKSGALVIDDGKTSNPVGFKASLQLIKELPYRNKVLLTGGVVDLGKEGSHIHRELAEQAFGVIDKVYYVGLDGIEEFAGVFGKKCITDKADVIRELQSLSDDTVILIEGYIKPDILKHLA